jgi:hypothetical protein
MGGCSESARLMAGVVDVVHNLHPTGSAVLERSNTQHTLGYKHRVIEGLVLVSMCMSSRGCEGRSHCAQEQFVQVCAVQAAGATESGCRAMSTLVRRCSYALVGCTTGGHSVPGRRVLLDSAWKACSVQCWLGCTRLGAASVVCIVSRAAMKQFKYHPFEQHCVGCAPVGEPLQ